MGMAGLFPQGVQYPTGSPQQGVHYPQQGVQTLSGPPQGVHLVPGTSQPPVQFTTGVQQQQRGSFPDSVHLGQSPTMPFHLSQLFAFGSQGSGQDTLFPNAFNTTTLQEPASGNWNMDTGSEVLRRLVSIDSISCNKEKLPVLCHACQLGKHVKLSFHRSNTLLVDVRTLLYKPTPPPPPTPQSVPQIVPEHAPAPTNDLPTVSIHPMVTHSRVGTTRPNPRYVSHVSTISPLPRSYKEAFNDPNWRNAMFDEYNALIKNKTWTSVPRPEGANIVRCM
ncbi:ribonuclease H-like domain-containing protein [Tanacetum coccineum]